MDNKNNANVQNANKRDKKVTHEIFSWNGATISKIAHGSKQQEQSSKEKNEKDGK